MSILDGSRGVAAFVVMLTHGEWTSSLVPTGAFAVDYFFVLSGLVMAHAYENRLRTGSMSLRAFLNVRFVRLYPMVAIGTLIASGLFFVSHAFFGGVFQLSHALEAIVAGLLLIPLPPDFVAPGILWIYPFNLPSWSIFYETLSNIVFAPLARFITLPRLIALAVFSGLILMNVLWYHRQSAVGIMFNEVPEGCVRTFYAFTAGIIISKIMRPDRAVSIAFLPFLLLAFLAICHVDAKWSSGFLRFWWIVSTIVVMPLLVLLLAHMRPGPLLDRVCSYMGRLSYPLYLVHFPILSFFNRLIVHLNVGGLRLAELVVLQTGTAIVAGVAALHLFDEPVRAKLSAWMRRGPKIATEPVVP
jgi:peptidoglycan/LPS O-acetylase OafA/YrhL